MGWTNRAKRRMLEHEFHRTAMPTQFYLAFVTATPAPTLDTVTLGELTEIAEGNGYTAGGFDVNPDAVDFDTLDEAPTAAYALLKDYNPTATGGDMPPSGDGIHYVVLTDDNAVLASREVWYYWDLEADVVVPSGIALLLQDLGIYILEP